MKSQLDHNDGSRSKAQHLWDQILKGWTAVRDPQQASLSLEERYRMRINTGGLLIFVPLTALYALLSFLGLGENLLDPQTLRIMIVSALVVCALVVLYLFNRGGARWVMGWVSPLIALALILIYATVSAPPHIEIIGLIVIPLIGSYTLKKRDMMVVSLLCAVIMVVFVTNNHYLDRAFLGAYYVWFYAALCLLIFYLMSQREWLDARRSEASVAEKTERELLVQYLPGVVWQVDGRMQVTLFNQQMLPSASAVDALRLVQSLLKEDDQRAVFRQVMDDNLSLSIAHRWQGAPYRTFLRPVNQSDQAAGIICLTVDVHDIVREHERTLSEAIEAERRRVLKDFLDDATHDLRTPLSVIHTNLYLMERATDPEKLKTRRNMLKASISQLEEMLQNMFVMSRLDLLPNYVTYEFDINVAVSEAIEQIRDSAQEKQIEIVMELSPALPTMTGHSGELQLAAYHIARNAVQHSRDSGSIRVATRYEDRHIIVEIADTGEGIPAEDIPNIFKRFYRVDKARTLVGARNGMGLAIVKKVVEKHRGTIHVRSEVGNGTTFTMKLPL